MDHTILELKDIYKSFNETPVLKGINLSVNQGEFITLLGPSGCGKTTTLRIIAGLEDPDQGQVLLEGEDVTHVEPHLRNVNTVFQNYALFPHMTVAKNIAYSQKIKKVPKARIAEDVEAALELVQLKGYGDRAPNQLSGGQMQRVAIARAIINQPKVLLLDEPLGALDLQLRYQMQQELKSLQQSLGITFIYITHDQEEALNMSDRIVVMKEGHFEQIGSPIEIYNQPKTSFVADFVGRANLLRGTVLKQDGDTYQLQHSSGVLTVVDPNASLSVGKEAMLAVRSEYADVVCSMGDVPEGNPYLKGVVTHKAFAAGSLRITISLADGTSFTSSQHNISCPTKVGQEVVATWAPDIAVFVEDSGSAKEAFQ